MRRAAFALLCSCVLASFPLLSIPAQAGGYYYGSGYGGGYYGHRSPSNVWYSSSCCYRKIVRHERSVHFRRLYGDAYYGDGFYGRPYRSYYDRPYRHGFYDLGPRRYVTYGARYGGYGYGRGCFTGPYGGTICN